MACFTADAAITDEGGTYRGHDAIRRWREDVATRYTYTLAVLSARAEADGRYVVTTWLEGNFPGRVVELDYRCTLHDDAIAALDIA